MKKIYRGFFLLLISLAGLNCNFKVDILLPANNGSAVYKIGGIIYGLPAGGILTLQNNGGDSLTIVGNGAPSNSFTFSTGLKSGFNYYITVSANPVGKTCIPSSNFGTVNNLDVSTVNVTCLVGGAVNITVGGTAPVNLQITNTTTAEILTFNAIGTQAYAAKPIGSTYSVAITAQPAGLFCMITSGNETGFINSTGIFVSVNCANNPELTAVINGVTNVNGMVTISYTISNPGTLAANAFNVDFWANRATAPTIPLGGGPAQDAFVYFASLSPGQSTTSTISFPLAVFSGIAYISVDATNIVAEINETNNVSSFNWPANQLVTFTGIPSGYYGSVANPGTSTYNVPVVSGLTYVVSISSENSSGVANTGASIGAVSGASTCGFTNNGSCNILAGAATLTVNVTSTTAGGASYILSVQPFNAPPLTFNFESGIIPTEFSGDPLSLNWVIAAPNVTVPANASVNSFTSAAIGHNQSSCFSVLTNNTIAGNVKFDYSVSSEGGFDFLSFYINNAFQIKWSGAVPWAASAVYPLPPGVNTMMWCYTKDISVSVGFDKAWVDNIVIN